MRLFFDGLVAMPHTACDQWTFAVIYKLPQPILGCTHLCEQRLGCDGSIDYVTIGSFCYLPAVARRIFVETWRVKDNTYIYSQHGMDVIGVELNSSEDLTLLV